MTGKILLSALCGLALACVSGSPSPPPAPWSQPALSRSALPGVYVQEWRKAENRESCALIAPRSLGEYASANPRAATFSGGWAVAYDLPGTRSAFGVAGTGAVSQGATYQWPYGRSWRDGSSAGYGPEGGSGPNELAYLRIAGQRCLYNVWSRISRDHLLWLIDQLRCVE